MFAVSTSPGESLAPELQASAWSGQKVESCPFQQDWMERHISVWPWLRDCTGTLPGETSGTRAAREASGEADFVLQRQMADRFLRGLGCPFPEQSKAGMKATSVPEPGGLLWLLVGEA